MGEGILRVFLGNSEWVEIVVELFYKLLLKLRGKNSKTNSLNASKSSCEMKLIRELKSRECIEVSIISRAVTETRKLLHEKSFKCNRKIENKIQFF